jgi:hypothetical protein
MKCLHMLQNELVLKCMYVLDEIYMWETEIEVYLLIPDYDFVQEGNLVSISKCSYIMYEHRQLQIQDVEGLIELWGERQWW